MTPWLIPKGNDGPLLCKHTTLHKTLPTEILTNSTLNLFFLACVSPPTKYELLKDRTGQQGGPVRDRDHNKPMNGDDFLRHVLSYSFQ